MLKFIAWLAKRDLQDKEDGYTRTLFKGKRTVIKVMIKNSTKYFTVHKLKYRDSSKSQKQWVYMNYMFNDPDNTLTMAASGKYPANWGKK